MTTYDYENIAFTTRHDDCHECEAMLVQAYTAFKQLNGRGDVSTGDAAHSAEVAAIVRN